MTVEEIKNRVMFQTNNDVDDMEDYMPYLMGYINEGYDKLVYAFAKVHLSDDPDDTYSDLTDDMDEPALPVRFHPAIADWATWLVYRNGNPQKQQRGIPFRNAFEEMLASAIEDKSTDGSGGNNRVTHFTNIPR